MQMIADGKIKEGTVINRLGKSVNGSPTTTKYMIVDGNLKYSVNSTNIFNMFTVKKIMDYDFEILEDKTEEIEEIEELYELTHIDDYNEEGNCLRMKINELVRAVNKLNKQDTSKETNCMSE